MKRMFDLNVALGLEDPTELEDHENTDPTKIKEEELSEYEDALIHEIKRENLSNEEHAKLDDENNELVRALEEKLVVGTYFTDLESVYLLYCEYARCRGFSVRKGEQRYFGSNRADVRWKMFHCSCAGLPNYRSVKHRLALYKKLVVRTNCKVKLIVSREDLGPFCIVQFDKDHNHGLVRYDQSYLLRSSRNLTYAKKSVLEALTSVGIRVSTACSFMEKESGSVQNVGFTRKDAYNHMDKLKKATRLPDGDAWALVDHFTNKSNSDPFFFWRYQKDDDGRILNIFWRDSRCATDYDAFGDVLSVDTTYRTNRYELVCAPFVGINHHTNNVMFGTAFMSDETTSSFIWLFETFLESMQGKQPKMIFTDQCRAMMNAIDVTFPKSKHRLCQWHISRNCAQNFGILNGDASFKALFYKCMNLVESEEEFDAAWKQMMGYDLKNRNWYNMMHHNRKRWASVFTRGIFSAGLLATSRSESTNKALKNLVKSTDSLSEVVMHVESIQKTWRIKESAEDAFSNWKPGQVIEENELLLHAASLYTRTIYKQFESCLGNTFNVALLSENHIGDCNIEYTTRDKRLGQRERKVVFNTLSHVATCSCGFWETEGLICSHILMIYHFKDVREIPEGMILRRWTQKAKMNAPVPNDCLPGDESSVMKHMIFANETMRHLYEICQSGFKNEKARGLILAQMRSVRAECEQILSRYSGKVLNDDPKQREDLRDPAKISKVYTKRASKTKPATTTYVKKSRMSIPEQRTVADGKKKLYDPLDGIYDDVFLSL